MLSEDKAARFQDVFYRSADGRLTLFARDYPADGPALLMMHGLTRNSADFEGVIRHLYGRFRIIVPDQRGRGRSEYDPDPEKYSIENYCADMRALLRALNIPRPILIGTSMGGAMAMAMVAAEPLSYQALIINDIGPVVEHHGLKRIAHALRKQSLPSDWRQAAEYCRSVNSTAFPKYTDCDWDAFARRLFLEDADGIPRLAYDPRITAPLTETDREVVPMESWSLWNALCSLPVLVVRGALSDVLSDDTLKKMGQQHSNFRSITIPNVGHAPMLDEPEARSAIECFLCQLNL